MSVEPTSASQSGRGRGRGRKSRTRRAPGSRRQRAYVAGLSRQLPNLIRPNECLMRSSRFRPTHLSTDNSNTLSIFFLNDSGGDKEGEKDTYRSSCRPFRDSRKRNRHDSAIEKNAVPALHCCFLNRIMPNQVTFFSPPRKLLCVQRPQKRLVRGWEKFFPALA